MTKEQKIDKIVKDLPIKEMRNKMTDAEWHGWFLECWNEAIDFTHCSTQLKIKKKWCYTTWKKHSKITTIHKQKYVDNNGTILKATEVRKMYQDYLTL